MVHNSSKLFDGVPCPKGHGTLRYKIGKRCIICAKDALRRYHEGGAATKPHVLEWSRAVAIVKGEPKYWGLDCSRLHGGLRYTSDRQCVACTQVERREKYRKKVGISRGRNCAECDRYFEPVHLSNIYCSEECKRQKFRRRARELYPRKPPKPPRPPRIRPIDCPQQCIHCGNVFVRTGGSQIYCTSVECADYRKKQHAERGRKGRLALKALEEIGIEI